MTSSSSEAKPTYVIVGAYGGVGSELAKTLHARGARLLIVGKNADKLSSLAERFSATSYVADASIAGELEACAEFVKAQFGTIDGVACVTGTMLLKPAHRTSELEWNSVIAHNLSSAFNALSLGARAMMSTGGSIVLMSSTAARVGLANHEALSAAKAGVEGLVRSAAASYARQGIRVNCVAPGMLSTPMNARLVDNKALLENAVQMYPLARMGTAQEIAGVIDWLLSPASGWVTGQSLVVDGGLSSVKSKARPA